MSIHRNRPNFITVEGIDGVGKSTAVDAMCNYFNGININTQVVRQNRDTTIGQGVRDYIATEDALDTSATTMALLFSAAINDTIERIIEPAHLNGKVVISDRYTMSTRVYQENSKYIDKLCGIVENQLMPDIIFILDAPPTVAISRILGRGEASDAMESQNIEVLNQRRKSFIRQARLNSKNAYVIDASGTAQAVADQIIKVLDKYY